MFDFRYHALSLAAVLVALIIGLLLGVAIGDEGLVSSAQRNLQQDLEKRVTEARSERDGLRDALRTRQAYEERTLGRLVGGRLTRRRIAVLFLHQPRREAFDAIRDAVTAAGGEVAVVASLREPVDLAAIGDAARGTRYAALAVDEGLHVPFAQRAGRQFVGGGRLVGLVRRELFSSVSGEFDAVEGAVLIRGTPGEDAPNEDFVNALVAGMRQAGPPVVGVERTTSEPSQVRWYSTHDLPSVDNVDQPAGQASLVFALSGEADGAYGVKPSADALVPEALSARE